jgi:acetylornithine/succinyldiaminopimelate/putrescine aminotransferase
MLRCARVSLDARGSFTADLEDWRALFIGLSRLREKYSFVREVRGKGLMIGLELSCPGRAVVERAIEQGLLINCVQGTVIRLLPPYILSEEEEAEIVQSLDATPGQICPR